MRLTIITCLFLFILSCKVEKKSAPAVKGTMAKHAMVVSAREEASKIGLQIMKKGGNAFDAMVATEFALAVVYPVAGNIGGGGFMVFRLANGEVGALDYREMAPLSATSDMFLDKDREVVPGLSTKSSLAIAVPGTVKGMFEVHERFGKLSMNKILKPVIELAKSGFVVTEKQAHRFAKYRSDLVEANGAEFLFSRKFLPGDTIRQLALAETLQRISSNGSDEFYAGFTADILSDFIQDKKGILTKADLQNYQAIWRKPLQFEYDNLNIISMSPPSSGGVCLGQILKMVEPFGIEKYDYHSSEMIQLMVEAERRSYADRSFYLGDPEFYSNPTDALLDSKYLQSRMSNFDLKKATKSEDVSHGSLVWKESEETTHYSIVDDEGNAVAATTTINGAFGSKIYCAELGFFLNNEMDDFSAKPGVPNMFGLIGAEANAIQPGKRMLSSMTPTIVEKDNALYMVLGTPGGSTIITSVLQTILNVHEFGMGAQEAVASPRFHHQWLPDEIKMEPGAFNEEVKKVLAEHGYTINESNSVIIGKVECILIHPDGAIEGGADPRGDDFSAGY